MSLAVESHSIVSVYKINETNYNKSIISAYVFQPQMWYFPLTTFLGHYTTGINL